MQDETINIAKGLAIVLMVVGHSGCPPLLHDAIYLFHMPLFFFISGWVFKEQYLDNKFTYFVNRLKRLYSPFVRYGLLFLLLHNLFYFLNFYNPPVEAYTKQQLFQQAIKVITFRGSDQLLGGFWFLKVLFSSALLCLFCLYGINKFSIIKKKNLGKVTLAFGFLIATFIAALTGIETKYFVAATLFMAGSIVREHSNIMVHGKWYYILILLCGVLIVAAYFKPLSMFGVRSPLLIIYYLSVAFLGIFISLLLAQLATKQNNIKDAFVYIGQNTMLILIWHMLSFKLVSLIKVWQYGLPFSDLGQFPVINAHNSFYWILYSIVGVLLPMIYSLSLKLKEQRIKRTV